MAEVINTDDQGTEPVTPEKSPEDGASAGEGANKGTPAVTPEDIQLPEQYTFGGKYKTVSDLEKAHKALQAEMTRKGQAKAEPAKPAADDLDKKPVTHGDLKRIEETRKLRDFASSHGLNDKQTTALAAYGDMPENSERGWDELAIEIGLVAKERVEKAKAMRGAESKGNLPVNKDKKLTDMTPDEIAALPPEQFEKLSNALSTRRRFS